MCRINWSGGGCRSHLYNGIYLRIFCMYGTHLESGPIGMFCSFIYFLFKMAVSSTSLTNMGLTLQYINPIEVLQDQYKGWKSRRYHIQIVVLPIQFSNDLILYFGK